MVRLEGVSRGATIRRVTDWNFADIWEAVAAAHPETPALVQGDRRLTWREFDRRANAVAAMLLDAGLGHQAKVAQYLYNGTEYMESFSAALKAGFVPVNTNYRYTEDELAYLWNNADAEAVMFDHQFTERAAALRDRVPSIRSWLSVGPASEPCPDWAVRYEDVVSSPSEGPVRAPWGRSGDDLIFIYTGGTTGMPKGVMWRQDDLFSIINRTAEVRYDENGTMDDVRAVLAAPAKYPPPRLIPGPPLMHGTGLLTAMSVFDSAGCLVLLSGQRFDVEELLDTIQAEKVTELTIVGDAFAKPILAALDAQPGRWDLSSLWLIISAGVMWSAEVKAGLLKHIPRVRMVDQLGSSEAIGMGMSQTRAGHMAATGGFKLGHNTRVVREDGTEVSPGSGQQGMVALRGRGPIGYYKDEAKSAATFKVIDGVRWTIPGDWATVTDEGEIKLLGRGSVCINTGGEKVFPEEVEEAIKLFPSIADAVVVGVPDDRFGEAVVAIVECRPNVTPPEEDAVVGWVKQRLASYKAPRRVLVIDTIGRAPNGKVDYRKLKAWASERVVGATT